MHFSQYFGTADTKQYLHSIQKYMRVINIRDDIDGGGKWVALIVTASLSQHIFSLNYAVR